MANIIIAFLLTLLGAVFFTHMLYLLLDRIQNYNKKIIIANLSSFAFCSYITTIFFASGILFEFTGILKFLGILYSLSAQILTYLLFCKVKKSEFDKQCFSRTGKTSFIISLVLIFFAISLSN